MSAPRDTARTVRRMEAWTWILLYGGLLGFAFGLAVQAAGHPLGWPIIVGGAAAAAVGVLLIVLRSRLPPGDGAPNP